MPCLPSLPVSNTAVDKATQLTTVKPVPIAPMMALTPATAAPLLSRPLPPPPPMQFAALLVYRGFAEVGSMGGRSTMLPVAESIPRKNEFCSRREAISWWRVLFSARDSARFCVRVFVRFSSSLKTSLRCFSCIEGVNERVVHQLLELMLEILPLSWRHTSTTNTSSRASVVRIWPGILIPKAHDSSSPVREQNFCCSVLWKANN